MNYDDVASIYADFDRIQDRYNRALEAMHTYPLWVDDGHDPRQLRLDALLDEVDGAELLKRMRELHLAEREYRDALEARELLTQRPQPHPQSEPWTIVPLALLVAIGFGIYLILGG